MSVAVNLAVIALYNGLCRNIIIFDISAIVTIAYDMETLITKLGYYRIVEVVTLLLFLSLCVCTLAILAVFAFLFNFLVICAVVLLVGGIIKRQKEITIARI